jgi:hypothetical protein
MYVFNSTNSFFLNEDSERAGDSTCRKAERTFGRFGRAGLGKFGGPACPVDRRAPGVNGLLGRTTGDGFSVKPFVFNPDNPRDYFSCGLMAFSPVID